MIRRCFQDHSRRGFAVRGHALIRPYGVGWVSRVKIDTGDFDLFFKELCCHPPGQ